MVLILFANWQVSKFSWNRIIQWKTCVIQAATHTFIILVSLFLIVLINIVFDLVFSSFALLNNYIFALTFTLVRGLAEKTLQHFLSFARKNFIQGFFFFFLHIAKRKQKCCSHQFFLFFTLVIFRLNDDEVSGGFFRFFDFSSTRKDTAGLTYFTQAVEKYGKNKWLNN